MGIPATKEKKDGNGQFSNLGIGERQDGIPKLFGSSVKDEQAGPADEKQSCKQGW